MMTAQDLNPETVHRFQLLSALFQLPDIVFRDGLEHQMFEFIGIFSHGFGLTAEIMAVKILFQTLDFGIGIGP